MTDRQHDSYPRDELGRFVDKGGTDDGGFVFGESGSGDGDGEFVSDNATVTKTNTMTNQQLIQYASRFGTGLYTGFVEWRAPPDAHGGFFKLGFVAGFALKIAIILLVGTEYLPV